MEIDKAKLGQIKELLRTNPRGMNVSEIAEAIGVNRLTASKYLDMLVITGHVDMKAFGPAKVYYSSRRMPVSAMLSLSSDMIIVLDKDLRAINVNEMFLKFTGLDQNEISFKSIDDLSFPGKLAPLVRPKAKEALDGVESTVEAEFERDGKSYVFHIKIIPIVFDEGNKGVTIIAEDITERKRIEGAVRESEEKFRSVIEQSLDGIMLLDSDGTIIEYSRGAEDITGTPFKDCIGKKLWETGFITRVAGKYNSDYTTAAGLNNLKKFILEYTRTCVPPLGATSFDLTYTRPDNEKRTIQFNYSPIRTEKGNLLCTIARDITPLKAKESELENSKKKLQESLFLLQTLIDALPNPIYYKDPAGRYLGCNAAFERFVGLSKAQIIGKNAHGLYPGDLADIYHEADEALLKSGGEQVFESRIRYADGTLHDAIFYKATFSNPDGKPGGLIGTIMDVTGRKNAGNALRADEADPAGHSRR